MKMNNKENVRKKTGVGNGVLSSLWKMKSLGHQRRIKNRRSPRLYKLLYRNFWGEKTPTGEEQEKGKESKDEM